MNATKRKFNSLLQGLGSRPSSRSGSDDAAGTGPASQEPSSSHGTADPSSSTMLLSSPSYGPSSTARDLDFLTKRRRVGTGLSSTASTPTKNGLSSLPSPVTSGTAPTTISNIVLRKWSGSPAGSKTQTGLTPPRYCPGDREQLLRRLATFQELTDWTPKPDRVSEVEWAKKGWACQGKERVRCTLCSRELVVKLNRREVDGREVPVLVASEIEDALVDRYVELMVTSHTEECLWRKKGCDDALLRLPLANPRAALEGLRRRYDELCARRDFLPYEFNLRLPEGLDVDAILSSLPPSFFAEPPPPPGPTTTPGSDHKPNRSALALAVMGWQGLSNARIGPVPNSASCHTCLRRLGLWMFKSKELDPETNTVLVPAPMDHLDPVVEHRFYCPWKNGALQRNPGGGTARPRSSGGSTGEPDKPGWEVLVQVLRNDAYLRNRNTTSSTARPRSRVGPAAAAAAAAPGTPTPAGAAASDAAGRPTTPTPDRQDGAVPVVLGPDGGEEADEDEATRAAKDKERWARLRRVKSLFDNKGGKKKLRPPPSRPETGQSSTRGGD